MDVHAGAHTHTCTHVQDRGDASSQRAWAHTRRTNRPLHTDTLRTKSSLVIFRFCTKGIHDPFAVGPCVRRIIISIKLLLLQGSRPVPPRPSLFSCFPFRYRLRESTPQRQEIRNVRNEGGNASGAYAIYATRISSPPEKRRSLQRTDSIRHA